MENNNNFNQKGNKLIGNLLQNYRDQQQNFSTFFRDRVSNYVQNMKDRQARYQKAVQKSRKKQGMLIRETNTVAYLQDKLWRQGFFGNIPYNQAVDGIMGKMTKEALDRQSRVAKTGYKVNSCPLDRNGKPTEECAAYVNGNLQANGINSWGSAYAVNNQFKKFKSGYDNMDTNLKMKGYSRRDSTDAILDMNHKAADNLKNTIDINQLNPDHIYTVNMYYNGSPKVRQFYNAAKQEKTGSYGTHVGQLYMNTNGEWIVSHNIHGNLHFDNLNSILGGDHKYGITSISDTGTYGGNSDSSQNKKSGFLEGIRNFFKFQQGGTLLKGVTVTALDPRRAISNGDRKFIQGINSTRNYMMQQHGLTDAQWANQAKHAYNIAGVESKHGETIRYQVKENLPDTIIQGLQNLFRGRVQNPSRGYTQIKILPGQSNLNTEYKKLGITDEALKVSPYVQGAATVLKLNDVDNYLNDKIRNKGNITWKDGSPMSREDARNIVWNRGRVSSGLNDKNDTSNSGVIYIKKFKDRSLIK